MCRLQVELSAEAGALWGNHLTAAERLRLPGWVDEKVLEETELLAPSSAQLHSEAFVGG